ncbi:hypothetical protein QZH41_011173, partial [Actinostola sp. cb2023]
CAPNRQKACLEHINCYMLANKNTCLCPPPLNITSCTSTGWIRVNTDPVCLQPLNKRYGTFIAPYTGVFVGLKLVHISGNVKNSSSQISGYWGTTGPQIIEMVLTTATNAIVSPPAGYSMIEVDKMKYTMKGFTNVFPPARSP